MFGRFTIVARNLGIPLFLKKNVWVKKKNVFFWKTSCLSTVPKRIRSLIKPLLKNRFSTNFQGTEPWEGWSWGREKKETPVTFFFSFSWSSSSFPSSSSSSPSPSFSFYLSLSLFLSLSLITLWKKLSGGTGNAINMQQGTTSTTNITNSSAKKSVN